MRSLQCADEGFEITEVPQAIEQTELKVVDGFGVMDKISLTEVLNMMTQEMLLTGEVLMRQMIGEMMILKKEHRE